MEKEDAATDGEALASLGGIAKVDSRMLATDLEVDTPTKKKTVALPVLMDAKVVEVAPAVAPPALPTVAKEEEMQVVRLSVSVVLVEPITIETTKEEVPITMGSLVIDARALLATANVLMGKVVGEAKVPTMASFPAIQAMAKVLLTTIELLVVKVVGEMAYEVGAHGEAALSMVASCVLVHLAGAFPIVTGDSSSGRLHYFPPHASRVPDPLLKSPIDCLTQSLQVGRCLPMLKVFSFDLVDHFLSLVGCKD